MPLRALAIAGFLVVFAATVWTAAHPANQWDFRTYYAAAKAHEAGKDPYDPAVLREFGGPPETSAGYAYAPHTLRLFRPLAALDYRTASLAYLGAKCVLFVVLLVLWRAVFLRGDFNVWFLPFAALAFNGALSADLVSGNVQMFELFLLWLAFACYVKGWDLPFGVLVLAAASFRLWPVVFLGLYLFRGRGVYGLILAGAFAAGLLAVRRFAPEPFAAFLRNALAFREGGWTSPSLWWLIQAVREYASQVIGSPLPNLPAIIAYGVLALVAASLTVRIGTRVGEEVKDEESARAIQVYVACLAYVLIVPHLRPSGYMILLVPAFHLLRNAPPLHAGVVLGVMAALPANPATGLPQLGVVGVIVGEYYLWLTAAVFWGLYCYQYRDGGEYDRLPPRPDAVLTEEEGGTPAPGVDA